MNQDFDFIEQSDRSIEIDWEEEGVKINWPFGVHESCVSESFEHVYEKAKYYVHGGRKHISFVNILNMEPTDNKCIDQNWRVDLSIWRIKPQQTDEGKFKMIAEKLLDRAKATGERGKAMAIAKSESNSER